MSKKKSMKYQVQGELSDKLCIGQSRHKAKNEIENRKPQGIYSWSTYQNYVTACTAFGKWVKAEFKVSDIKIARNYVEDYLKMRIDKGLSAWTVSRDAAALAKLYGCSITDFKVKVPQRKRGDVRRSRGEIKDFNEKKHHKLVEFCKGTGLRVSEIRMLKKENIFYDGNTLVVFVEQGKGGKCRLVPVIEKYEKRVFEMSKEIRSDGERVFKEGKIPRRAPVHKYRAMYAKAQYERLARKEIPKSDRYVCRKDKAGIVYDKKALAEVSQMLGHNRIDVVAGSYLY